MGDEMKALESLQKAHSIFPEDEKYVPVIKEVFDKDGIKGVLQWEIEYDLKDTVNGSLGIANNYMMLGEKEKALDYLEMTFNVRYPHLPSEMYSVRFKSLRNEPRFQALLDSMNLTPYQATEINSTVLKK
jgi:tetratricopeptide (TPR) repeat protein